MATRGQVRYKVGFDVDSSGIRKIQEALRSISNLQPSNFSPSFIQSLTQQGTSLEQLKSKAQEYINTFANAKLNGKYNMGAFLKNYGDNSQNAFKDMINTFTQLGDTGVNVLSHMTSQWNNFNLQTHNSVSLLGSLGASLKRVAQYQISTRIFSSLIGSVESSIRYVKELDQSLTDIQIVTGKSADEMMRFASEAQKAAKGLSASTTDYTKASLIYYQQGLSDKEVEQRAKTTVRTSHVTGQSTQQVSQQLTSVWNGYNVALENTEGYVGKLAAVASHSASNLAQLSTGMSKVASTANSLGVNIDQLSAQMATIISTTRQAPESVGTALKTIYARMSDIKAGIDGETSLGNYTSKMAEMGVNVLDVTGNLRDMGTVIEQIGGKWQSYTRQQQISLAQTMAGQRQYNNMIALFDNWGKYQNSVQIAAEGEGTLLKQDAIYNQSIKAHSQKLATAGEGVAQNFYDREAINGILDFFTSIVQGVDKLTEGLGGFNTIIVAIGAALAKWGFSKMGQAVSTRSQQTQEWQQVNAYGKTLTNAGLSKSGAAWTQLYQDNQTGKMSNEYIEQRKQAIRRLQQAEWKKLRIQGREKYNIDNGQQKVLNIKSFTQDISNISTSSQGSYFDQGSNLKGKLALLKRQVNKVDTAVAEKIDNIIKQLDTAMGDATLSADKQRAIIEKAKNNAMNVASEASNNAEKAHNQNTERELQRQQIEIEFEDAQGTIDALNNQQDTQKIAEGWKEVGAAVGEVAIGMQQLINIGDIWGNDSLSFGEKVLKTFMALAMALPMVADGLKKIRDLQKQGTLNDMFKNAKTNIKSSIDSIKSFGSQLKSVFKDLRQSSKETFSNLRKNIQNIFNAKNGNGVAQSVNGAAQQAAGNGVVQQTAGNGVVQQVAGNAPVPAGGAKLSALLGGASLTGVLSIALGAVAIGSLVKKFIDNQQKKRREEAKNNAKALDESAKKIKETSQVTDKSREKFLELNKSWADGNTSLNDYTNQLKQVASQLQVTDAYVLSLTGDINSLNEAINQAMADSYANTAASAEAILTAMNANSKGIFAQAKDNKLYGLEWQNDAGNGAGAHGRDIQANGLRLNNFISSIWNDGTDENGNNIFGWDGWRDASDWLWDNFGLQGGSWWGGFENDIILDSVEHVADSYERMSDWLDSATSQQKAWFSSNASLTKLYASMGQISKNYRDTQQVQRQARGKQYLAKNSAIIKTQLSSNEDFSSSYQNLLNQLAKQMFNVSSIEKLTNKQLDEAQKLLKTQLNSYSSQYGTRVAQAENNIDKRQAIVKRYKENFNSSTLDGQLYNKIEQIFDGIDLSKISIDLINVDKVNSLIVNEAESNNKDDLFYGSKQFADSVGRRQVLSELYGTWQTNESSWATGSITTKQYLRSMAPLLYEMDEALSKSIFNEDTAEDFITSLNNMSDWQAAQLLPGLRSKMTYDFFSEKFSRSAATEEQYNQALSAVTQQIITKYGDAVNDTNEPVLNQLNSILAFQREYVKILDGMKQDGPISRQEVFQRLNIKNFEDVDNTLDLTQFENGEQLEYIFESPTLAAYKQLVPNWGKIDVQSQIKTTQDYVRTLQLILMMGSNINPYTEENADSNKIRKNAEDLRKTQRNAIYSNFNKDVLEWTGRDVVDISDVTGKTVQELLKMSSLARQQQMLQAMENSIKNSNLSSTDLQVEMARYKKLLDSYNTAKLKQINDKLSVQKSEWQAISNSADKAISTLSSFINNLDSISVVKLEELRQSLLGAGLAAGVVEDTIKRISQYGHDNSKTNEAIITLMEAQTAAALAKLSAKQAAAGGYTSINPMQITVEQQQLITANQDVRELQQLLQKIDAQTFTINMDGEDVQVVIAGANAQMEALAKTMGQIYTGATLTREFTLGEGQNIETAFRADWEKYLTQNQEGKYIFKDGVNPYDVVSSDKLNHITYTWSIDKEQWQSQIAAGVQLIQNATPAIELTFTQTGIEGVRAEVSGLLTDIENATNALAQLLGVKSESKIVGIKASDIVPTTGAAELRERVGQAGYDAILDAKTGRYNFQPLKGTAQNYKRLEQILQLYYPNAQYIASMGLTATQGENQDTVNHRIVIASQWDANAATQVSEQIDALTGKRQLEIVPTLAEDGRLATSLTNLTSLQGGTTDQQIIQAQQNARNQAQQALLNATMTQTAAEQTQQAIAKQIFNVQQGLPGMQMTQVAAEQMQIAAAGFPEPPKVSVGTPIPFLSNTFMSYEQYLAAQKSQEQVVEEVIEAEASDQTQTPELNKLTKTVTYLGKPWEILESEWSQFLGDLSYAGHGVNDATGEITDFNPAQTSQGVLDITQLLERFSGRADKLINSSEQEKEPEKPSSTTQQNQGANRASSPFVPVDPANMPKNFTKDFADLNLPDDKKLEAGRKYYTAWAEIIKYTNKNEIDLTKIIRDEDGKLVQRGELLGRYLAEGITNGFDDNLKQKLINADLDGTLVNTVAGIFGIASPSKLMIPLGTFIAEGLAVGIDQGSDEITESFRRVQQTVLKSIDELMTKAQARTTNARNALLNMGFTQDGEQFTYSQGGWKVVRKEDGTISYSRDAASWHDTGLNDRLTKEDFETVVQGKLKEYNQASSQSSKDKKTMTQEYFGKGGYLNDTDLSPVYQSVIGDAVASMTKQFGDNWADNEKNFPSLFQKINSSLAQLENEVNKAIAEIQGIWVDGLTKMKNLHEETAKQLFNIWKNQLSAIVAVNAAALKGQTAFEAIGNDATKTQAYITTTLRRTESIQKATEQFYSAATSSTMDLMTSYQNEMLQYAQSHGKNKFATIMQGGQEIVVGYKDDSYEAYKTRYNREYQAIKDNIQGTKQITIGDKTINLGEELGNSIKLMLGVNKDSQIAFDSKYSVTSQQAQLLKSIYGEDKVQLERNSETGAITVQFAKDTDFNTTANLLDEKTLNELAAIVYGSLESRQQWQQGFAEWFAEQSAAVARGGEMVKTERDTRWNLTQPAVNAMMKAYSAASQGKSGKEALTAAEKNAITALWKSPEFQKLITNNEKLSGKSWQQIINNADLLSEAMELAAQETQRYAREAAAAQDASAKGFLVDKDKDGNYKAQATIAKGADEEKAKGKATEQMILDAAQSALDTTSLVGGKRLEKYFNENADGTISLTGAYNKATPKIQEEVNKVAEELLKQYGIVIKGITYDLEELEAAGITDPEKYLGQDSDYLQTERSAKIDTDLSTMDTQLQGLQFVLGNKLTEENQAQWLGYADQLQRVGAKAGIAKTELQAMFKAMKTGTAVTGESAKTLGKLLTQLINPGGKSVFAMTIDQFDKYANSLRANNVTTVNGKDRETYLAQVAAARENAAEVNEAFTKNAKAEVTDGEAQIILPPINDKELSAGAQRAITVLRDLNDIIKAGFDDEAATSGYFNSLAKNLGVAEDKTEQFNAAMTDALKTGNVQSLINMTAEGSIDAEGLGATAEEFAKLCQQAASTPDIKPEDKTLWEQRARGFHDLAAAAGGISSAGMKKPKGGGGGSGAKATKREKIEKDPYHDVNNNIEQLTHNLQLLQQAQDKTFGKELTNNLKQQLNLMKKQNEQYALKLKIAEQVAKEQQEELTRMLTDVGPNGYAVQVLGIEKKQRDALQKDLQQYFGDSFNLVWDADGNVDVDNLALLEKTWAEKMEQIYTELGGIDMSEANQKRYNNLAAYIKQIQSLGKNLDETASTIREIEKTMQTAAYTMISKQVENFKLLSTTLKDTSEAYKKFNTYQASVLSGWGSDSGIAKAAEKIFNLQSAIDMNEIESYSNYIASLTDTINTLRQGGKDSIYSVTLAENGKTYSDAKTALEDLKALTEQAMTLGTELQENTKQVMQGWTTQIQSVVTEYQTLVQAMQAVETQLQHERKLIELIYGETSYKQQEGYLARQIDSASGRIAALVQERTMLAQKIQEENQRLLNFDPESFEAGMIRDSLKQVEQSFIQVTSEINSSIESAMQLIETMYTNRISIIATDLEQKLTNAFGYDWLTSEWNMLEENPFKMFDAIDAEFALQKIRNEYEKTMNEISNVKIQNELQQLLDSQLDTLQEQGFVAQYNLDYAEKLLAVKKAQAELEDAQANKSTLRLRRDSQGNYTYQYVSDEDEILSKQQALRDAQQEFYDWARDAQSQYLKSMVTEWTDAIKDISDLYSSFRNGSVQKDVFEQKLNSILDAAGTTLQQGMDLLSNGDWGLDFAVNMDLGALNLSDENSRGGIIAAIRNFRQTGTLDFIENLRQADYDTLGALLAEQLVNPMQAALDTLVDIQNPDSLMSQFLNSANINLDTLLSNEGSDVDVYAMLSTAIENTTASLDIEIEELEKMQSMMNDYFSIMKEVAPGLAHMNENIINGFSTYFSTQKENAATYTGVAFDTGGYTGSWGSEGKLAMLHQKELILNASDTQNMLDTVRLVRDLDNFTSMELANQMASINSAVDLPALAAMSSALDQNVHIEANFPNVSSSSEIRAALSNLVNTASQRAMMRK